MKNFSLTLSCILLAAFFIQGSWTKTNQTNSTDPDLDLETCIFTLRHQIKVLNATFTEQISLLQQANAALNASLTAQISQLQQENSDLNASLQQANSALNTSFQQANSALSASLTSQIQQATSNLEASLASQISELQQDFSSLPDTITQQLSDLNIPKTEAGYIFRSEGDPDYGLMGSIGQRKTDCTPVTFDTPFSATPFISTTIAQLTDESDGVSLRVYPQDITESGFTICASTQDQIDNYNSVWVAFGSP